MYKCTSTNFSGKLEFCVLWIVQVLFVSMVFTVCELYNMLISYCNANMVTVMLIWLL